MSTPVPSACPSCGAALSPASDRCDLCGTSPTADAARQPVPVTPAPHASALITCPTCGHENPAGARFCNECGTALGAKPTGPAVSPPSAGDTSGDRPPSDVGKRAVLFVGAAIGVVLALYALTALVGGRETTLDEAPNTSATPAGTAAAVALPEGDAPPLPAPTAQSQADAFEAEETAEGYYESARYYLTAAYENQQSNPEASRLWAHEAVVRLEQSLEATDNPDVRVALAEATAFEGVDPMRPIQEAQAVLDADPTHPGANLFMGQRRLMIGRVEQAREAFETVIANTEAGDPARASAESALAMIASQTVPSAE